MHSTGVDRTNLYAEAAHQALYSVLSGNHPHLLNFIQLLLSTQKAHDLSMEHIFSGINPAGKQLKYKLAYDTTHRLVSNFNDSSNIVEFSEGVYYNFT